MGTTYKEAIFCGDMAAKLAQFGSEAGSQTFIDITSPDANGPIRIDSLIAATNGMAGQRLRLFQHNGINSCAFGVATLNRPVKNVVTNASITFAWAATTITRSAGSWLGDGFKIGDMPVIQDAPVAANNLLGTLPITSLTDTVMTIGGATMTALGANYGKCSIAVSDEIPSCTDLLAADAFSGLVGHDAAGNRFLELPKGWKLQVAPLVPIVDPAVFVNVQARWGTYATV